MFTAGALRGFVSCTAIMVAAGCSGGGGGSSKSTNALGDAGDACALVADLEAIGTSLASLDLTDPASAQQLQEAKDDLIATLDDLAKAAPDDIKRDVTSMKQKVDEDDLPGAAVYRKSIADFKATSCTQ